MAMQRSKFRGEDLGSEERFHGGQTDAGLRPWIDGGPEVTVPHQRDLGTGREPRQEANPSKNPDRQGRRPAGPGSGDGGSFTRQVHDVVPFAETPDPVNGDGGWLPGPGFWPISCRFSPREQPERFG